jgi:hypothetical protein
VYGPVEPDVSLARPGDQVQAVLVVDCDFYNVPSRSARDPPSRRCSTLTSQQIEILRHHTTRFMAPRPSNQEATMALAEFGGHLRSNGPPGWAVLGRALERLLLIEVGWNQRGDAIDD